MPLPALPTARLLSTLTFLFSAVLGTACAPALAATESGQVRHALAAADQDTGRVIVKFRSTAGVLRKLVQSASSAAGTSGPQAAATLAGRLKLSSLSDGRALDARTQVMFATGMSSQALATRLAADAEVEWAVVDGRRRALAVPSDPLYPEGQTVNNLTAGQWYLHAPSSSVVASANVVGAWNSSQGRSDVVVAVLDTGIRPKHPDLAVKLLAGRDFVSDTATANDGDGWDADPSDPGDWITSGENASGTFKGCGTSDSSWHGTLVSGIIGAATQNGIGIAGTAPNALLLPVRVLGKCGGFDSDIIAGMRWAAGLSVSGVSTNTHPAQVLNLSLGGSGTCSTAYQSAISEITAAGAVIVVAAGNEASAVGVPANCSGVMAVAGLRHAGTKSGFSSLGPEVAIAAPAGNCVNDVDANPSLPCVYAILSTRDSGTQAPVGPSYSNASTPYEIGTSFSTPIVAGTAALMLSANPSLSPTEVRSLIQSSARAFPTTGAGDNTATSCSAPVDGVYQYECYCTTTTCGAGMLDASAAVLAAANLGGLPTVHIAVDSTRVVSGSVISLDGSASLAGGTGCSLSSHAWQILSGSTLASWSGSTTGSSASLTTLGGGTVIVRLTVTDSAGQSSSADQVLQVIAAPVASITTTATHPTAGEGVTLSASGSQVDSLATIASYLWEITDGASLASWSGSTTSATATLNLSAAGSVTVRLTLTDSFGNTSTATQTLTVGAKSSGGGGGAMTLWWAAALALLGLGLPRRQRQRL